VSQQKSWLAFLQTGQAIWWWQSGVLKSVVFMCPDPAQLPARLNFMIEDAQISVLLTLVA
jgi:hypothetical protein